MGLHELLQQVCVCVRMFFSLCFGMSSAINFLRPLDCESIL